jgi:hypothetical protein
MHLLGFRFAPRMRDFADRRLYVLGPAASYRRLTALIADSIRADLIEESWDELLRLATSIKVGAIAPSVMRTRLAAYPRQGSLAEALRELGRIERTLFALDWLDHPALRRPSLVALTGRESHPSFKRTVFFNRLGERCDRTFGNQGYHASGLDLVIAPSSCGTPCIPARAVDALRVRVGPCLPIPSFMSRRSAGSMSATPAIAAGPVPFLARTTFDRSAAYDPRSSSSLHNGQSRT